MRRTFTPAELQGDLTLIQCGSLFNSDFYRSAFEAQVGLRLGPKGDVPPRKWVYVKTGTEATLALAEQLLRNVDDLLSAGPQFRPLIYHPRTLRKRVMSVAKTCDVLCVAPVPSLSPGPTVSHPGSGGKSGSG